MIKVKRKRWFSYIYYLNFYLGIYNLSKSQVKNKNVHLDNALYMFWPSVRWPQICTYFWQGFYFSCLISFSVSWDFFILFIETNCRYSHVSNKRWHHLFIIGNCSTQIPLIIVQKNSPFIKFEKKIAARLLFKPHRLLNFKIFQHFLTQNSPFIEFLVCIGLLVTTYLLWYTLL